MAAVANCLDREGDLEPDAVLRAWRRYQAAVLRDLARREPSPRGEAFVDSGIYALAKPHLESLWRDAHDPETDIAGFEEFVLDNFGASVTPYLAQFLGEIRSWRSDTRKLLDVIGCRLLLVIEDSEDPDGVMEELAAEAERRGLIEFAGSPRRESPLAFVMDLWWDNPVTLDRVNLHADQLDPLKIDDLASALEAIR